MSSDAISAEYQTFINGGTENNEARQQSFLERVESRGLRGQCGRVWHSVAEMVQHCASIIAPVR